MPRPTFARMSTTLIVNLARKPSELTPSPAPNTSKIHPRPSRKFLKKCAYPIIPIFFEPPTTMEHRLMAEMSNVSIERCGKCFHFLSSRVVSDSCWITDGVVPFRGVYGRSYVTSLPVVLGFNVRRIKIRHDP
ncbi:unnamed protein product [Ixodes persulcatus]